MIIGHGDISSILNDRLGVIFFASGVSDSSCMDEKQFERERDLFMELFLKYGHLNQSLFYFSSLSVYFKNTAYTRHKLKMEQLVKNSFPNYTIIRIGNITWGKNPKTFINYFRHKIENDLPYTVLDEYRYLISQKELLSITDNFPDKGRHEISVTGRIVKVQDVVNELINEQSRVHTNHK